MCSDSSVCGGGSCIDYGASYTCDCGEAGPGRGPSCDMDNVCRWGTRGMRHVTRDMRHLARDTWQCCRSGQCQEGSTCVLDMQEQGTPGYTCVCPLGRKVWCLD